MKKFTRMICLVLVMATMAIFAMGSGSSDSSYQLYNEDGSINQEYYNDMNDYFEEHPDKLPE